MKNLNKSKKIIVAALILGIILPFSPLAKPKQAEAIAIPAVVAVPVIDASNLVVNTASAASNAITAGMTSSLVVKEYTLDPIAYALEKVALGIFSQVIVDWINNAFPGGNPLYPTNFTDFVLDLGDERIGAFMDDLTAIIGNVCAPFRPDLLPSLQVQATPRERDLSFDIRIDCTLDDVVADIDDFYGGDFFAGGWEGFLTMTQDMQNNPYGALMIASAEMEEKADEEEIAAWGEIDAGQGIAGIRDCIEPTPSGCRKYEIRTPGSAISTLLGSGIFESSIETMEQGDELLEIVISIIGSLITMVFGPGAGIGGLLNS